MWSHGAETSVKPLLPTLGATDWKSGDGPSDRRRKSPRITTVSAYFPKAKEALRKSERVQLLPTPAVNDMGANKTLEWWDEWAVRQKAADGRPAPHGKSLHIEMLRLADTGTFGDYTLAVDRWQEVFGHAAPEPTAPTGKDGRHQLRTEFPEWMMGLPAGWVTDVGLTRTQELRALGNGVVPLQAAWAIAGILELPIKGYTDQAVEVPAAA